MYLKIDGGYLFHKCDVRATVPEVHINPDWALQQILEKYSCGAEEETTTRLYPRGWKSCGFSRKPLPNRDKQRGSLDAETAAAAAAAEIIPILCAFR